jgi:hypothetical protein
MLKNTTKVIGTASNCFTVSHVETIDKPVYIEGDAPANTVAILGSLPIGTAPVFYLNPANEIAPELSEGKFCLIRIGDGRGFLGVVVACCEKDKFDISDLNGNCQIRSVTVKSVTPIISAQFAA